MVPGECWGAISTRAGGGVADEADSAALIGQVIESVGGLENNSPMVGYLASGLSRGVTGQVFVTGADSGEWMRQGTLTKSGSPFTPGEIHSGAEPCSVTVKLVRS
ncbi:hypothetical protein ACFVKB_07905 [Rhodococcus sp. NPDC127530]|uniref:hypothetical protein n=1 Tax=unclassified Rhodococcus (in: high G+C Gram-positive bacteria) TaxID=192944 RepID=UPI00363EB16D